jgi:hypothetical protein
LAIVKFINGKNEKIAGLIRAIDYVIDENKTDIFIFKDVEKDSIPKGDMNKEMILIQKLLDSSNDKKDLNGQKAMNYITRKDKTNSNLVTGINCNPESAIAEMMITKKINNKLGGRQFIHFVHSFSPKEEVEPEKLHEISLELLKHKKFKGFEILAATHIDRDHIHTHFILNTVNQETGLKWQQSQKDLNKIKMYSNELCHRHGLKHSIVDIYSYKYKTFLAAKECRNISISKDNFIDNMNKLGYKVRWEDSRKDITFIPPKGKKINNDKLYPPENYTKEALLKRFELNKQYQNRQKEFQEKQKEYQKKQDNENKKQLALQTLKMILDNPRLQNYKEPKDKLQGRALKEEMLEQSKGKGFDWDIEL